MRRRWFAGGIRHQITSVEFDLFQNATQQISTARSLVAEFRESVTQFGERVFLKREPRFQFDNAILQWRILGRLGRGHAMFT